MARRHSWFSHDLIIHLAAVQAYEQELQKAMAVPLPDAGAQPSSFCPSVALSSGRADSPAASAILTIADCL